MAKVHKQFKASIIVISDTASRDPTTDKCIPALQDVFKNASQERFSAEDTVIVSDNIAEIQRAITLRTDGFEPFHLIVTSGGTGFTAKDVTPEAVTPLIDKHAPGLVHGMLAKSLQVTPFAVMARPVAGVRKKTLIITLPGSPKGAKENLESIVQQLPHACEQAFGGDSRALHKGGTDALEKDAGISKHMVNHSQSHADHSHGHSHGHSHHGPKPHTRPEDRSAISNDPKAGPTRRYRESPYPMISVDDALDIIRHQTPAAKSIIATLDESVVGSVLAADITAAESVPAFRASIVDGYAVVVSNRPNDAKTNGVFPVTGVSHAQAGKVPELKPGTISRITTGAALPPGATSVVMVEDTVLHSTTDDGKEEKMVEILVDDIKPGENVREVGSDVQAGDVVMKQGEEISAVGGEFGLLASVGIREISVYRKPVVGVLSTGDEIVSYDRPGNLRLGEVRDTNRPTLLTTIRGCGFKAIDLGISSDKAGALEQTLRDAMRSVDVIVTTGGVSMGELDLLKPTIERALNGVIHFGRISMKPGKPTTFATVRFKNNAGDEEPRLIFSLPGNPASAVVTFYLFVLPSLHQMSGITPVGLPRIKVVLDQEISLDAKRNEYHRVSVSSERDGLLHAKSTGGQRSSRIGSLKSANALLCLPAREGSLPKGATADALLMGRLLGAVIA